MGFFSDIWDLIKIAINTWKDVFGGAASSVFNDFFTWVTDTINYITGWIRWRRHQLIVAIAQWLKSDFNFLLMIIGAIFLAVAMPAIVSAVKAAGKVILASAIVKQIKETTLKIIDVELLIDIKLLSTILYIIWPDYTAQLDEYSEAISSLAWELGEGTGYLHAYFAAQRTIVYSSAALVGVDPKMAELEAYEQSSEFFRKIDDRFKRYAFNPGLIITDFIEEVLIPAAETLRDAQQGLVSDVRENYNRGVQTEQELKNIKGAVNTFIEAMPDEIAFQLLKRWKPIDDKLNKWIDFIDDELMPKIDGIISAAEERAAYQDQANAYAQKKLDDPLNSMINYELANEEQQRFLREHNLLMTGASLSEKEKAARGIVKEVDNTIFTSILNLSRSLPGPLVLRFEPAGVSSLPRGPASKENWFIGEY